MIKYFFGLVIILIGSACSNRSDLLLQANQISLEVGEQLAPDRREAIYDVSFSFINSSSLKVSGETSLPEAKLALFSALEDLKVHLVDSLVLLPEEKLGRRPGD